jgi:Ras-related protein Rab-5C
MYYRGAQAALVVYDIGHSESLRRAKFWVRELRQVSPHEMVIGLAGNKIDLGESKRQIDRKEVVEYAEEAGLIFMETSAKRGDNVAEIFLNIARQVVAKQPNGSTPKAGGAFPASKPPTKSGGCCGDNKSEGKS